MRLSILLLVCVPLVNQATAISFDAVVSLGDSLLDDSGGGRSPLVSEHVASRLSVPITQLAVSGSTSSSLLAGGQHTQAAASFGSGDLAVLWIGGNDFFANSLPILFGDFDFLDTLQSNVETAVSTLRSTGMDVLLFNLPDMAQVPAVITTAPALLRPQFTAASQEWSTRLDFIAAAEGAHVVDVFTTFDQVVNDPAAFAVNGTPPILGPSFGNTPTCPFCLFADSIHPSSLGQGYIANTAFAALNLAFDPGGVMPISLLNESELFALTGFVASPDFDLDGNVDGLDVDALVAEIVSGTNDLVFDLTGDANVDRADLDQWLADAGGINLASGAPYLPGDANLDGLVDVTDFNAWNSNRFTAVAAWTQGDFTANGQIDASDFNEWNAHKFMTAVAPVPEPSCWQLMVFSVLAFVAVRRPSGLSTTSE